MITCPGCGEKYFNDVTDCEECGASMVEPEKAKTPAPSNNTGVDPMLQILDKLASIDSHNKRNNNININDVNMPFGSMVLFMVKWVFASIPAMLIVGGVVAIAGAIFGGIFGGHRY